ncbi:uncharacterized protein LOC123681988 [Harmonia axyridis]|uniref:uncharacterized protein LOC123681988 n=1 Tax=Harmonia axyridis TaxID=115357 RepID=UPI001E276422|nr:uncharacterized protein LOC123681988 [Harmonia axyridis]
MAKLVELIVCTFWILCFVDFTKAIECYTCSSLMDRESCEKPEKYNVPRKVCNKTSLNDTLNLAKDIDKGFSSIFEVELGNHIVPTTCLKQITMVGEKHIILRGCQLLALSGNLNVCNKVKKYATDNLRTSFCELCNTKDGCNSSGYHPLHFGWILLSLINSIRYVINT